MKWIITTIAILASLLYLAPMLPFIAAISMLIVAVVLFGSLMLD